MKKLVLILIASIMVLLTGCSAKEYKGKYSIIDSSSKNYYDTNNYTTYKNCIEFKPTGKRSKRFKKITVCGDYSIREKIND